MIRPLNIFMRMNPEAADPTSMPIWTADINLPAAAGPIPKPTGGAMAIKPGVRSLKAFMIQVKRNMQMIPM